jgi:AraC-like DNA-binding protein
MRVLRAPHALSAETIGKVAALADSELTVKEIAETTGISPSSVHGIFKNSLPCAQYERRQRRMRMLRQKRSLQGLEKAGRLGSASERAFHRLLSLMLRAKVRHHDVDLLPPYEIDITIPAARIAVLWDGIGHFKPIFGQAMFEKVRFRDAWKRRALARMGWKVFAVKDMNSRMRAVFLEKQAQRLALMLETEKLGHLIRRF